MDHRVLASLERQEKYAKIWHMLNPDPEVKMGHQTGVRVKEAKE